MKRRFPRRGPLPFRQVFVITFVIFIIVTFQGLWIINKGIEPTLISIAEKETRKLATLAINDAVSQKIAEDVEMSELVFIEKDEQGKITGVGWNPTIVNEVLAKTTSRVQRNLKDIEEGNIERLGLPPGVEIESEEGANGIIKEIPLGQATNNVLLANLGPKVPVRFTAIGDVQSDVKKKITGYGINNSLIEISVHVEVSLQVVIPFATKSIVVSNDIPVDIRVLQGDVPYFYNSGDNGVTPSFTPPGQ